MPMKKSGLFRNKNAKATPYKDKGVTEVGKEAKTQSYKEYVQKMFGGGMTEPAMKKNKMMGGGMIATFHAAIQVKNANATWLLLQ
jgi:hypothetical protein